MHALALLSVNQHTKCEVPIASPIPKTIIRLEFQNVDHVTYPGSLRGVFYP